MRILSHSLICLIMGATVLAVRAQEPKPAEAVKVKVPVAVYDEKADAKARIDSALVAAKRENRRVLIQWGANWCSWCVKLHDTFKTDAAVRKALLYEYDVVFVDVGKMDRNLDLATQYGAEFKKHGIPYLTILDADGKALVNQQTDPFEINTEEKKGHDPKKVLEFLTKHQAEPRDAGKILDAALADAARSDKRVFLHFGAPWCGWCHRLEQWLATPETAAMLAKDFVDLKIDTDRMTGAKDILDRYKAASVEGIPWIVFLDSKGKPLADGLGPKGNIGFPAEEQEILHFGKMLEAVKLRLTENDIGQLKDSLTKLNKARVGH